MNAGSPGRLDRIEIAGIRAYGKHGADAGERDQDQPFELDLTLYVDLAAARRSDALHDTVDYASVAACVTALVRERSYRLLERLGAEVLQEVLRDERVVAARVRVAEPGLLGGATPSVTLHAARDDAAERA